MSPTITRARHLRPITETRALSRVRLCAVDERSQNEIKHRERSPTGRAAGAIVPLLCTTLLENGRVNGDRPTLLGQKPPGHNSPLSSLPYVGRLRSAPRFVGRKGLGVTGLPVFQKDAGFCATSAVRGF